MGKKEKKQSRKRKVALVLCAGLLIGTAPVSASFLPGGLDLGGVTDQLGNLTGGLGNLSGSGGSGSGGLGGLGNAANDVLSPIEGYLQQIQQIQQQVDSMLDKVLQDVNSKLAGIIKGALGDLNLPDPDKLLEGLTKNDLENPTSDQNSVSGLNPVILKDNLVATVTAKVFGQQYFSKEAQTQAKKELEQVAGKVQTGSQFAQASSQLSQQSSQSASSAGQIATQAQSRVSTQDALKDLNKVTAELSKQLASQSGQLTNISGQEAAQIEIQALQTTKLTQIGLSSAASVLQLAQVNDQLRGTEQKELIADVALGDRLNRANSTAISFMR